VILQRRERGTLEPLCSARHVDHRSFVVAVEESFRELIELKPDATLREVAQAL
jgi:hypothetical protein